MSKCPACGYWAFNGEECFDCGYRSSGVWGLLVSITKSGAGSI